MGKHDRHRPASQGKDWDLRPGTGAGDAPHASPSKDGPDPRADLDGDEEPGGIPPSFAREIKIGLAALGALLLVLGVVLWSRLRQRDQTPPPPEKVAGTQQADAQSPPSGTATFSAKAPRELTATEPKEPLLASRRGPASAAQARVLDSELPGPGPANPFGAQGGPSFMPKATKPAGTAPSGSVVAGAAHRVSPLGPADALPPEPPGDEVTVGEGPVDPFRNKASEQGATAKASPAVAPSAPADVSRQPATATGALTVGGWPSNSPNPLRGASPSVGQAPGQSGPWGAAVSATASPAPPTAGLAGGPTGPAGLVQGIGSLPATSERSLPATPEGSLSVASGATPPGFRNTGSARRVYIVREGDTLYDIARNELGKASRWGEIYDLNWDQLGNRVDGLVPGMKLLLPEDAEPPAGMLSRNPHSPGTTATLKR